MLDCGDVVLSVVVISSPTLVSAAKDLARCNKRSQLTPTTIRSMEGMDDGKARALCHLTGFDLEEWEATHYERISSGNRVIDLGD